MRSKILCYMILFSSISFAYTDADWAGCKDILTQAQMKLDDLKKTSCPTPQDDKGWHQRTNDEAAWKEQFRNPKIETIELNSSTCSQYIEEENQKYFEEKMNYEISEPVIVSVRPYKGMSIPGVFPWKKEEIIEQACRSAVSFGKCGVKIPKIKYIVAAINPPSIVGGYEKFYKYNVESNTEKSFFVDVQSGKDENFESMEESFRNITRRIPRRNDDGSINKNPIIFFVRNAFGGQKEVRSDGKVGGWAGSPESPDSRDEFGQRTYPLNTYFVGTESKDNFSKYMPGGSVLAHELGHFCTENIYDFQIKEAFNPRPNIMSHNHFRRNGDFGHLCPMVQNCGFVQKVR